MINFNLIVFSYDIIFLVNGGECMFLELFLEGPDKAKLELYRVLQSLTSGEYSISFLNKKTSFSYAKTHTALFGIIEDLADLHHHDLKEENGRVVIEEALPSFETYQQYLVENSLLIRVFQYILVFPNKKLDDFCQENFISRATVFRKLQPMEKILAPYDIQFKASSFSLQGSEGAIRYFLCNLMWYLGPGKLSFSPKKSSLRDEILMHFLQVFDPVTQPIMKEKILLTFAITELRRLSGNFIPDLRPQEEILVPPSFWEEKKEQLIAYLAETTPEEYLDNEIIYLYFLIFSGAIYTSKNARVYELQQEWRTEKTFQEKLMAEFFQTTRKDLFQGNIPKYYRLLQANLLGTFNASFLLEQPVPVLTTFLEKTLQIQEEAFLQLENYCKTTLAKYARRKNLQWLSPCVPSLAASFAHTLWPSYQEQLTKKTINVTILLDANFNLLQPLYYYLDTFSFVTVLPYEKNIICDLLILQHEHLIPEDYKGKVFLYTYQTIQEKFSPLKKVLLELKDEQDEKNSPLPKK